jgi:DNA-binding NarL/FixJ family response regulator
VVIAADPLVRGSLAASLAEVSSVQVVGQLAAHSDPAGMMEAFQPSILVLDGGWDVTSWAHELSPFIEMGLPILLLMPEGVPPRAALAAGARGVVRRQATGDQLAAAVLALGQGLTVLDAGMAAQALPEVASGRESAGEALTPRELDVLRRVAEGRTNKDIAHQLGISESTVKFHLNAILGKLGAQSRTDAVMRAVQSGLLPL